MFRPTWPTDSQLKKKTVSTNCCGVPPDDGLQICPKHVEANWRNILRIFSASSWFIYTNIQSDSFGTRPKKMQISQRLSIRFWTCIYDYYIWTFSSSPLVSTCFSWSKVCSHISIYLRSYDSCRRLPEPKHHSFLFNHWSASRCLVSMAVCTPSIHVFFLDVLFFFFPLISTP
jgi:hypothetical protein